MVVARRSGVTILAVGLGICAVLGLIYFVRRRLRSSAGGVYGTIEGFVGRPGQGKTTLAVQWAFARADLVASFGKPVVIASNIALVHPKHETIVLPVGEDGFSMEALVRLAYGAQQSGGAVVLLIDEANIVMPSRMWKDFGLWLMWFFQQSRHLHVEVVWTAQSETFIDTQLRQLTAATHSVRATPPATVVTMLANQRPLWIRLDTWDRTAVGVVEAWLGTRKVRYRKAWESTYNTREFVLPPAKLAGAGPLLALLEELLGEAARTARTAQDGPDVVREGRSPGQWQEPQSDGASHPEGGAGGTDTALAVLTGD